MRHHPTLPPSSFPARCECACFMPTQKEEVSDDTAAGKGVSNHDFLSDLVLLGPEIADPITLESETTSACRVIYAAAKAAISAYIPEPKEILVEQELSLLSDETKEEITFGTADLVVLGEDLLVVLDWKSGFSFKLDPHDYREQLAFYALAAMRKFGISKAVCMIGYIMPQTLKSFDLTYAEAAAIVQCIIDRSRDPNKQPQPCNYCKYCRDFLTCPAVNRRLSLLEAKFNIIPAPEDIQNPEKITDPQTMATVLTFARGAVSSYKRRLEQAIEEIEDAALTLAQAGNVIPGYEVGETKPRKFISNVFQAFELSGLPQDSFAKCLKASIPDLADAAAAEWGLSKKLARDQLERIIGPAITTPEAKPKLVEAK